MVRILPVLKMEHQADVRGVVKFIREDCNRIKVMRQTQDDPVTDYLGHFLKLKYQFSLSPWNRSSEPIRLTDKKRKHFTSIMGCVTIVS